MYFNFSKLDYSRVNELLEIKENNILAAEFYNLYLSTDEYHFNNEEIMSLKKKEATSYDVFNQILKKMNISYSDENYLKVNKNSKLDNLIQLDEKEYIENPYFKLIKSLNIKEKNWYLSEQYYLPYEAFAYDEIRIDSSSFKEVTPFAYFKDRFFYPAIIQDETIWMSLIPHEINTMKEPINEAYGNVLVFGLGLGYYAYMVSNKDNVNKVTIIEKDKTVIDLFNKYLINLFPHKQKIKIINEDAFNYLDNMKDKYDYTFVDIYHNVGDGFPLFKKFKSYEKRYINTKFRYWIETSLLAMMRRYVLTLYEEKTIHNFKDEDYLKAKDDNDRFINKLYFYLKDYEFNSFEEFRDFLSDESLNKILINLK